MTLLRDIVKGLLTPWYFINYLPLHDGRHLRGVLLVELGNNDFIFNFFFDVKRDNRVLVMMRVLLPLREWVSEFLLLKGLCDLLLLVRKKRFLGFFEKEHLVVKGFPTETLHNWLFPLTRSGVRLMLRFLFFLLHVSQVVSAELNRKIIVLIMRKESLSIAGANNVRFEGCRVIVTWEFAWCKLLLEFLLRCSGATLLIASWCKQPNFKRSVCIEFHFVFGLYI